MGFLMDTEPVLKAVECWFYADDGRLFHHHNDPIHRLKLGTEWPSEPENELKYDLSVCSYLIQAKLST